VTNAELQGWHPDPFGLHEMRYFSAGRPTKLVRDGRVEAYHEPPQEESASTAAAVSVTVGGVQGAESDEAKQSAIDGATRVLTPGADLSADTARNLSSSSGDPFARKKRRGAEYIAVAAGAVVAVLVFVLLNGGSGTPGIAPAAFVTKAAQRTLNQNTADVTVSGTVRSAGVSIAMGGSGQIDFATNAMSLSVGATLSGGSLTETELLVGGNLYLDVTADGHSLAAVTGGRHWLQIPFAQAQAQVMTKGSPGWSLSFLKQKSGSVVSLGPRSINGQTCNGYAVTPTKQAMVAAAEAEGPKMGLSQAETSAAVQALQDAPPPTIRVWFDSERQLACQLTIDTQVGVPTLAGSGSAQMIMTFTHYGVPVKVTAPAPSDTVPLKQLLQGTHQ
jgi:hypothetical protein